MTERQRLDKWLWFARIVKTRSLAAKLVTSGYVRLNAQRMQTPAKAIGPGDVLTISLDNQVRVLRVVTAGSRRGPASEARLLFEDLSQSGTHTRFDEADMEAFKQLASEKQKS